MHRRVRPNYKTVLQGNIDDISRSSENESLQKKPVKLSAQTVSR